MSIYKDLFELQQKLIVAKSQRNNFGNYNYRSCEDILEAVKKVSSVAIVLDDELLQIGDRYYIKATATIYNDKGESVYATGFARESLTKKGMDDAQITGSVSSYARKYALNALFAIDDTKDADTLDNRHELSKTESDKLHDKTLAEVIRLLSKDDIAFTEIWHECDRPEQSAIWKKLNTKQKDIAKQLLDQLKS